MSLVADATTPATTHRRASGFGYRRVAECEGGASFDVMATRLGVGRLNERREGVSPPLEPLIGEEALETNLETDVMLYQQFESKILNKLCYYLNHKTRTEKYKPKSPNDCLYLI